MITQQDSSLELYFLTLEDDFPHPWVTATDIDFLITLITSKEKCPCIKSPESSTIPTESADLGGYAIRLINSFRANQKLSFSLWSCPRTNEKDVQELTKWWKAQQ